MRGDDLDFVQAMGLFLAISWAMLRAMNRLYSSVLRGAGNPEIESPFRKDTPSELRIRKILLVALLSGSLLCMLVLIFPNFPGVKDLRLYRTGLPIYFGLAIWHSLHLKGIVKRRTLWPGYVDQNTRENKVKEILVLRAHERGERIPTVEEVREAAQMPKAEFDNWLKSS